MCQKKIFGEDLLSGKKNITRLFFLGDSAMKTLVNNIMVMEKLASASASPHRSSCRVKVFGERCNTLEKLGMERLVPWKRPARNESHGPLVYGLKHPGCSDCLGCGYTKYVCPGSTSIPGAGDLTVEFLPVEFALDRELQSRPNHTTTQETVLAYMGRKSSVFERSSTVCLVNVGLHVKPGFSSTFHVDVQTYLEGLRKVCGRLVWFSVNAVRGDRKYRKSNQDIARLNHAVLKMLRNHVDIDKTLPLVDVYVDVFNASLPKKNGSYQHQDNVHMELGYYRDLGRWLMATQFRSFKIKPM